MDSFFKSAKRTFEIEARAIQLNLKKLDAKAFEQVCKLVMNSSGRVIVTGVGKSGHIANKIASTLASTGTPAFFLHPAEAAHGDVGMVQREDVIIVLSKSGASDELLVLLPSLRRIGVPIVAITRSAESKLAIEARESGGASASYSLRRRSVPARSCANRFDDCNARLRRFVRNSIVGSEGIFQRGFREAASRRRVRKKTYILRTRSHGKQRCCSARS